MRFDPLRMMLEQHGLLKPERCSTMYSYKIKGSGEVRDIPPRQEAEFFRLIHQLTGLDKPMAIAIMANRPIDHPKYEFRKEP